MHQVAFYKNDVR